MSIKTVHAGFIAMAAALAFGFGVWGLRSGAYAALGAASLLMGAALVVYGAAFLRKMKARGIA